MSSRAKYAALSALWFLSACAGRMSKGADDPSATGASASSGTAVARAPDAVYLDPPAALPEATSVTSTTANEMPRDPVVMLREPMDAERVRAVAAQFFDALARQDEEALAVLLTSDALSLEARAQKAPLLRQLRQRLHQHDFSKLLGLEAARPRDIVTYERQLPTTTAAGATDPHDADVAVRIPMENPRPAGEPLFADTVYLLLRDEHGALHISGESEDAAP